MVSKGGDNMNYKKILNKVANEYNTTPEEVDAEIRSAIKAAGYNDISPELFIALISTKVKNEIRK